MKKVLTLILLTLFMFPGVATTAEMIDVKEYPSCSHCGMNREMFAHSRMLTTYSDNTQFPSCSIHCTALDFANQIDKMVEKIEVADYNTKKLVEAESAVWVIGGNLRGVMTARPKWAFADKQSAEAFIAENGGEITDFETAIKAAFEDMYKDTKMIRMKREKMRMKKKGNNHGHSHN